MRLMEFTVERITVIKLGKLVSESDEQEFSLRGVRSKKISSHPVRDLLKSVLKVTEKSLYSLYFENV